MKLFVSVVICNQGKSPPLQGSRWHFERGLTQIAVRSVRGVRNAAPLFFPLEGEVRRASGPGTDGIASLACASSAPAAISGVGRRAHQGPRSHVRARRPHSNCVEREIGAQAQARPM